MTSKALRRAFLFETIVGVATLVGVLLLEQAGIALGALLVFRPWVAGRREGDRADGVRRIYRDAFWIAIALTAVALGLASVAVTLELIAAGNETFLLLLLAFPLFMISHGLTGYLRSSALEDI